MHEITVGSSAECDVNIASDFVSRRHCKLLYAPGGVWIEDLDSSNGTYVDGRDIPRGKKVKIDVSSEVSLANEVSLSWNEIESFRPGIDEPEEKSSIAANDRSHGRIGQPVEVGDSSGKNKRPEKQKPSPEGGRESVQSSRSSSSEGSVAGAIFTMLGVSLLLFWLPLLGPVVAGFAGGKKAKGVGKAVLAALLPGLLAGILAFALASSISGIPLLGAIAGVGSTVLALAHIGPLLLGAIIGGAAA